MASWNSLECFCSFYHIYTTSFILQLNITLRSLIVELALFSVLGVALCVHVCVCAPERGGWEKGESLHCVWPKQELFTSLKEISIMFMPRQQPKEEEAQDWP